MKVYRKMPKRELIIVKTDSVGDEYEFWTITPLYVGTVRKIGTQRIVTEDRQQFTNLNSAARYLLEQGGETELADTMDMWMKKDTAKVEIDGLDLVEAGKWAAFCKLREISVRDTKAMNKRYYLDQLEVKKLGVKA